MRAYFRLGRWLTALVPMVTILGVLAAACLQYVYLDALLEVVSLRQLIIFLSGAH